MIVATLLFSFASSCIAEENSQIPQDNFFIKTADSLFTEEKLIDAKIQEYDLLAQKENKTYKDYERIDKIYKRKNFIRKTKRAFIATPIYIVGYCTDLTVIILKSLSNAPSQNHPIVNTQIQPQTPIIAQPASATPVVQYVPAGYNVQRRMSDGQILGKQPVYRAIVTPALRY